MNITIIGTGYVGLTTGACLAQVGNKVICLDINKEKIRNLKKGFIPIYEPNLQKIVLDGIRNKNISFSTNYKSSIEQSRIIFITVGTPMSSDGKANLEYIFSAAKDIGKYINKKKIIITKSTVPVGTTLEVKKIINKEIKKRNQKIEFDIANNPEFLKEGKAIQDFMSPDRIIVGVENSKIKKTLKSLYKPFSINHEKLIFMDISSSELTKYAANAMLATKISFINEMSIIAEKFGADINKVRIGIGSDKRIGYNFIYPSIGYGGSCFPKDISSLIKISNSKGYIPKIINAVKEVNENQKKYFIKKIFKRFCIGKNNLKGLQFGIWGLSFKPGTDDMREAPSVYIIKKLIEKGAVVKVYDPRAMENAKLNYFNDAPSIVYCKKNVDVLNNSDALILLTEWQEFRSPSLNLLKLKLKQPIIFDGRNQYNKSELNKSGFEYYQIGA